MKENGATINDIGSTLKISKTGIITMLYNRGKNRFIKGYKKRLENDNNVLSE